MIRRALMALSLTVLAPAALSQEEAERGSGAILRALDKVSGQSEDIEVGNGGVVDFGRITIEMDECRFPVGNPAGDAFAHLTIRDQGGSEPRFRGWMIASSPALSALDHPRYDVWVIRCKT